ncbi:hypothetical protein [Acididesulfobacillus acetoxydans]|nr:hypothetical protein [Acididesulfobacillus acetoxydans]
MNENVENQVDQDLDEVNEHKEGQHKEEEKTKESQNAWLYLLKIYRVFR